jgi:hypothetical protein
VARGKTGQTKNLAIAWNHDRREEHENASDSIHVNRELDSKATEQTLFDLKNLHEDKQFEQRIWQLRGIKID